MTDSEINNRICEIIGADPHWKAGNDFCNDLNAMHEAEKFLLKGFEGNPEASALWMGHLLHLVCSSRTGLSHHATARQRAEAFLKTLGKWEEMTLDQLRKKLPTLTDKQIELLCAELGKAFLANHHNWDKDYMLLPLFSLQRDIREAYLRAVGDRLISQREIE